MVRALLIVAGCLILLASCAQSNAAGPGDPPTALAASASAEPNALPSQAATITGTITQLHPTSILVEERPGEAMGGRKIVFTVTEATLILTHDGASLQPATTEQLRVGAQVEAWADGPIAESYPEQARASMIVIRVQTP